MHAARIHALDREPAAQIVAQRQGADAREAIEPDILLQHLVVAPEGRDGPVTGKIQEGGEGGGDVDPGKGDLLGARVPSRSNTMTFFIASPSLVAEPLTDLTDFLGHVFARHQDAVGRVYHHDIVQADYRQRLIFVVLDK